MSIRKNTSKARLAAKKMGIDLLKGELSSKITCQYCGLEADHKCGKRYSSCGNCCSLLGTLIENDEVAYHWVIANFDRLNDLLDK